MIIKSISCIQSFYRTSTFFTRTANEIWKSTTSVSNPGAKKGRGKRGSMRPKNLNIGQEVGIGKVQVNFPGLNSIFSYEDKYVKSKETGLNEDYERKLSEARNSFVRTRRVLPKSERGWSGGHIGGRSIGKLDPVEGYHSETFDTRVLHYSQRMIMTKTFGKRRRIRVLVACGNQNGLIGLGAFSGINAKLTIQKAKERAGRNLVYIQLDKNDLTILHNFKSEFGCARLYVTRKGQGNGLICHRLLRSLCELIGIENIYAKSDGSANPVSIANAFLLGLVRQKTYQQWADEHNLLVVSIDSRASGYPCILATPSNGYIRSEIKENEDFDFERLCLDGLTRLQTDSNSVRVPWYHRTSGYLNVHIKRKIQPLREFREGLVDTLASSEEYNESVWRYPKFDTESDMKNSNC